jgi:flavin reductase (DIM6/NTAB) family NADH-FMN oxidoreductase RutF
MDAASHSFSPLHAKGDFSSGEVSSAAFREVMGSFPTGVTVITTLADDGTPIGLTANAVSSVSLNPPQLLICLGREKYTAKAILSHQAFAVNFLARAQVDIAQRFASAVQDKFAGVEHAKGWKDIPVITGALAVAECEVQRTIDAGDHIIFVGLVRRGVASTGDPLMFFRKEYAGWPGQ